jgi:hypothetical protein
VEKLGAGSRSEGVETILQSALELIRSHRATARSKTSRSSRPMLES